MKYSDNNKPLVCMMTQSTCYKGTSKMTVKGVLWHSTGANNPNLKRYVQPDDNAPNRAELLKLFGTNTNKNDWNHTKHQAGLNAWIGKLADGTVTTVQTMPWDYKPWGCGSGKNGSCNNGWIQFEICEDNLKDKEYFEKIYKEACEITAYLCKKYHIDPEGTVVMNGIKVPTILCHQDSYKLGLGSNHGDVLHWFPKYGKTMDDVRKDVAALMELKTNTDTSNINKTLYRVRKSWSDSASQIGAYSSLENAKAACKEGYYVFDAAGKIVYPEEKKVATTKVKNLKKGNKGDDVRRLQNLLNLLGYSCGSADGSYGKNTESAVKAFQQANKITADGVFGSTSFAYLKQALTKTSLVFKYNNSVKNPQVLALQNILNDYGYKCGTPDGYFGTKTKNAVISFQQARKLTPDGIAGPKTIAQFVDYLKL